MYAPTFVPPAGATVYGPAPARPPVVRAAAPPAAPRRPASTTQAAAPPAPVFRGAPPEEAPSRPAPLVMPSPERLGVALPRPPAGGALDAVAVGRQLQQLGASGYHLDRLAEGVRFTCWIPGSQPGVSRRIEATAATESEAAQKALARAAQMNGH